MRRRRILQIGPGEDIVRAPPGFAARPSIPFPRSPYIQALPTGPICGGGRKCNALLRFLAMPYHTPLQTSPLSSSEKKQGLNLKSGRRRIVVTAIPNAVRCQPPSRRGPPHTRPPQRAGAARGPVPLAIAGCAMWAPSRIWVAWELDCKTVGKILAGSWPAVGALPASNRCQKWILLVLALIS